MTHTNPISESLPYNGLNRGKFPDFFESDFKSKQGWSECYVEQEIPNFEDIFNVLHSDTSGKTLVAILNCIQKIGANNSPKENLDAQSSYSNVQEHVESNEPQTWEGFVLEVKGNSFKVGFIDEDDIDKIPKNLAEFDICELTSEEQEQLRIGSCIRWEAGTVNKPGQQKLRLSNIEYTEDKLRIARKKADELLDGLEYE